VSDDQLADAAKAIGAEHGKQKAGWIHAVKITSYTACKIKDGFDNEESGVLDLCPDPMAGPWASADDPPEFTLLDQIATKAKEDGYHWEPGKVHEDLDILDVYAQAFKDGFWGEVIRVCNEVLEDANE